MLEHPLALSLSHCLLVAGKVVLFTGAFGSPAGLGLPQGVIRVWVHYEGQEAS